MNATTLAAWVGASTGVASLFWNVYVKVSAGPRVEASAYAGMIVMPPPPGNPKFLKINVRNNGTVPTTISNYGIVQYKSFWSRFRKTALNASYTAVITNHTGPRCPQKLGI